jgi:hypothetical protein
MIKRFFFTLVFFVLSIMAGCSLPGMLNVNPEPTSIPPTAVIPPSILPTHTFSPSPTRLPSPIQPPKATPHPQVTSAEAQVPPQVVVQASATLTTPAEPCNRAAPGRPTIDISVPDGAHLDPGQVFSKTWRLVNSGSCDWTLGYEAIWFSGDAMGPVKVQPIPQVPAGQSVDITVDLYAPDSAGFHQSNWKLRAADGTLFGLGPAGDAPFWIRIEVVPLPVDSATPAATATVSSTQPNP